MTTVYDVEPNKLIEETAKELKNDENIDPPEWSRFSKTGAHKERVPTERDWWYVRSAAILRRIYVEPQGVSRLKKAYGGRKNRGYKPEKFATGSGSIARKSLMQLEKAGLVKTDKKEKTGRVITPKGRKFLDNIAHKL
ncbi:MAG: 30S ribosomal protein S19e [Candidatus Nanohalarchaeota archaeon]|nr:MAG: 30S ribosomal protein S19e [Candidatus Nanohaloarchaeota archaeon]